MENTENMEGAGEASTEQETPAADDRANRAFAERDKARAEARAAKAELAKHEAEKRKAAEERERAAGDWKAVEARYQTTIRELEEQVNAKSTELEALIKGGRRRSFLDAIVSEGKIGNRKVAEALLPTLGLPDDAPESFTDADVKRAVKAYQREAPELFGKPQSIPKPPPAGGRTDDEDPDKWRKLAQARSTGGTSAAYDRARGRPAQ